MSARLLDLLTAARFDALLGEAVAGTPVLLRERRADTVADLRVRAETELMLEVGDAAGPGSPSDLLVAAGNALGAAVDDLRGLVASPRLQYALLVGRVDASNAADWTIVAGVFASLRRNRQEAGPALIVVTDRRDCPAGCRLFDDGELCGPAESALLARSARPAAGLIAQAADAAAIEVARGDPALLGRLLALGDADRFDPRGWVARQPASAGADPLPWRGVESACPVWLSRDDARALRRRVWRGQLSVLLPWMEELRADFLARFAGRLPSGQRDRLTGETVAVEDYEWGHIVSALRTLRAGAVADAADTVRRVRNALAHGDPAGFADAGRMEVAGRVLLGWR